MLILAVMLALASPFGMFAGETIKSSTQGLFDVNQTVLGTVGVDVDDPETSFFPQTTYYTKEEINKDPLLYGIGKTKSEYVVAKFNEDRTEVVITKNGDDSDGKIKDSAYTYDYTPMRKEKNLKKAIIKEGVTSIGIYDFCQCKSLETVKLPDSLISIGYDAFSECSNLKSITIPKNVRELGESLFHGCTNLTSATIKEGVPYISQNMFYNTKISTIILPDSITEIKPYAFGCCSKLIDINIPKNVHTIDQHAFHYCTSLPSITIPSSVKVLGTEAFMKCISLTDVIIEPGIETIGKHAFINCDALSVIKIPNTVTHLNEGAFFYCTSLKTIYLPKSVSFIDTYVFRAISKFSTIYCETQEVANLLKDESNNSNYDTSKTQIIVDASKF